MADGAQGQNVSKRVNERTREKGEGKSDRTKEIILEKGSTSVNQQLE